jgi:hypothetical protein
MRTHLWLRLLAWSLLLPLLALGCPDEEPVADDDDSAAADDDDSAGDGGWGDEGAQDAPIVDELPEYTNDSAVDITGTAAEPGSLIRAYGTDLHTTDADPDDGSFSVAVAVAPGPNDFDVTADLDGLESWPAGASIHRCEPGDPHELLGGDRCDDAIDLGAILDVGSQIQVSGNALEDGDEDWYTFLAADDVAEDIALAADDWAVAIDFIDNDLDSYAIEVYRGSCEALECADYTEPYTEYTSTLDQTPCGSVPYNDCLDDSTQFTIRVYPLNEDTRCYGYKLRIRNG